MQQVVSRADLRSPESSVEPEVDEDVLARLQRFSGYDQDVAVVKSDAGIEQPPAGAVDGDLAEFKLFATSKSAGEALNKIRLRSPTPPIEAGLINKRPSSHYFTGNLTDAVKKDYASAARSGAEIMSFSTSPWPGAAYCWKVLHLPPSGLARSAKAQNERSFMRLTGKAKQPRKRARKGKKARIMLRSKLAASRTAAETKEAEDREKRTKRNREKKVKKKLREKAKKNTEDDGNVSAHASSSAGPD